MEEIKDILESILNGQAIEMVKKKEFQSFLSVVGKSYNEEMISRLVAYCLTKDMNLIRNLYVHYQHSGKLKIDYNIDLSVISELSVVCEKFMGAGRADIFIKLRDKNGQLITITIENKTDTQEHSAQTQTYYNWVTNCPNYKDGCHLFFYLRPIYNLSFAQCKDFVNITYNDLEAWIDSTTNDPIIQDFLSHIHTKLGSDTMAFTEAEKILLDNYQDLHNTEKAAKDKLAVMQISLFKDVEKNLRALGYTIRAWDETGPDEKNLLLRETVKWGAGIGSYRLYKKGWYEKDIYYLYAEIKFHSGTLGKISFQETMKDYSKMKDIADSPISKFIAFQSPNIHHQEPLIDQYHVIQKENYNRADWDSEEWKTDFVQKATDELKRSIEDLDQVFTNFSDFLTQQKQSV